MHKQTSQEIWLQIMNQITSQCGQKSRKHEAFTRKTLSSHLISKHTVGDVIQNSRNRQMEAASCILVTSMSHHRRMEPIFPDCLLKSFHRFSPRQHCR